MPAHALSHAAEQVRRFDRERFATALFAPPERRERLMVLYAFNVEVAMVRESVREPMAGAIRLQWWREAVGGERPSDEIQRHPIAGPLRKLVASGVLPADPLLCLLEGRERDLSETMFEDCRAVEAYAAATSGTLTEAALAALGMTGREAVEAGRAVGSAYAMAGLLRSVPFQLASGRLREPPPALAEPAGARSVGERAQALLAEARRRRVPREAVPALLPATYASAHLRRLERAGWDVFAPTLAQLRPIPLRLAFNALCGWF